nr:alpha/beta hydrolases superfamily protein [Tanacetum cinerariifolium]
MRSVRIPKVKTKNTPWRVRDFKMFFNRRGIMRQPRNDKKTFQKIQDDKNGKNERKFFRCKDQNSLIGECPKPPKDKNQRAFIGGSWSDSGEEDDEKANDETCLMAQASKLLHMDIFDPSIAQSYRGNLYTLVIVDDYSSIHYPKKHTIEIKESLNVTFDETPPPFKTSPLVDDDLDEEEAIKVTKKKNLENGVEDETLEIDEVVSIKESRNHPLEIVIGNLNQRTLSLISSQATCYFNLIFILVLHVHLEIESDYYDMINYDDNDNDDDDDRRIMEAKLSKKAIVSVTASERAENVEFRRTEEDEL